MSIPHKNRLEILHLMFTFRLLPGIAMLPCKSDNITQCFLKIYEHRVQIIHSLQLFFKYRELPRTSSIFRRMHTKCMLLYYWKEVLPQNVLVWWTYGKAGYLDVRIWAIKVKLVFVGRVYLLREFFGMLAVKSICN